MKIIIFIIISILLSSCSTFDISKTLFIASVGIDIIDDKYVGYFYLPLSSDIGSSDSNVNKGQGHYAKTKGKNIYELFYNLENSSSLTINLKHISSIVLNKNLLNDKFIEELLNYIKYSLNIDFNFYIFITKEQLEDIYSFKNPNQESVLNSLLVSTGDAENNYLVTKPIHFLTFVREYYNNRSIFLPLLDLEEIWNIDSNYEKNFHIQSGIYYYKNNIKEVIKNHSSPYLNSVKSFYDMIEDNVIYFKKYKFKINYKKEEINIYYNYQIYNQKKLKEEDISNLISNRIKDYLKEYENMDPLNLNYYSYIYNKKLSYENIKINTIYLKN